MTEQPKKPSWETLAQELGAAATSPPVRARVEPPKPVVPPTTIGVPAPPPTTTEAPKKRGWDDLASWLGLGGIGKRTRPETAVPPVVPVVPPVPAAEPPAVAPPRDEQRYEPRRDRREERREPRREEPRPAVAPAAENDDVLDDLSFDRPEGRHAAEPADGESGEPARRRRRRRRGGRGRNRDEAPREMPRGGEQREAVDEIGPAEFARDFDDYDVVESERPATDVEDRGPPPAREADERDGDGEPRRRRRRRRRGRGGRDRDRDRTPAAERSDVESAPIVEDDEVLDVDEESITRERIRAEGIADELEEAQEDVGGEEAHLMHRGIPTWEEAIGMIVNVNLEARAKHPHSPSGHHHRGGRGRGRGGRDRGGR